MVTITDVARLANVSVATVSRVINGHNVVSEDTRKRIELVVAELGYSPNALGRNLRNMNTKIILIILPSITNSFFSKVVRGIEETGHKNGYNVMICTIGQEKDREKIYLNMVKERRADGAIILTSNLDDQELLNYSKCFPLVQCSEYRQNLDLPYVSVDNRQASKEAIEYLIELGHTEIGMISELNTTSSALREQGYDDALENAGITSRNITYGSFGYKSGYKAARVLLEQNNKLSAIFAVSDIMAIAAIRACEDVGKNVPDDISVMGFDDILFSYMFKPELTTISQPRFQLGEQAMELLFAKITNKEQVNNKIFLPHKIIIRNSTSRRN